MANPEENLRKYLQGIAEKENYKLAKIDITPITSEGANYSSVLYVTTISEQLKPDLHLFAKVANFKEEIRAQYESAAGLFTAEGVFYSEMVPNFERIYNKNNVPAEDRMLIPKYYGHISTPGSETLVLENLQVKGFLSYERQKPFSWEYASTAVTELAKFHAIGLALRDESPVEFEKIIGNLAPDIMTDENAMTFIGKSIEQGCEIVKDEYKSRLQQYFNVEKSMEFLSTVLKKTDMLVFADFRPSNLMHRRRNGKLEVITLDYQTMRVGNPVTDLLYFIFSASDEEFRRFHYKLLLDHYFSRLTHALKQLNIDVENVYPRKTFESDLKELYGLFLGLTAVPLFLVDPEDAPEIERMESFQVKPNNLAVERINGIVSDFVKWGVI